MPRERAFSEHDVLDRAADLFSVNGFNGTSVSMLTDATGLGKQSLYNAFGDKQALYLEAVECATARYSALQERMLRAADGRSAMQLFCDHLVSQCSLGDPSTQACIVSAGLLEGIDDPVIHARLCAKWHASHEMLRSAIERGQRDGSIRHAAPSAAIADLFISMMSGTRVMARTDVDPERLRSVTRLALSVLDQS
jgi:TetR/AcrR family transcriptional regulator, transcriptional repressor for nem operon